MAFLHVMWQITLLLCHISSILKSRSFGTLICVLISFWILSFYSRIVQGFSPKLSPKVKLPSPPKSPPRLLASPPYILESRLYSKNLSGIHAYSNYQTFLLSILVSERFYQVFFSQFPAAIQHGCAN